MPRYSHATLLAGWTSEKPESSSSYLSKAHQSTEFPEVPRESHDTGISTSCFAATAAKVQFHLGDGGQQTLPGLLHLHLLLY